MGQNSSKAAQLPQPPPTVAVPTVAPAAPPMTPGFGRAQTMLDVAQFSTATSSEAGAVGGLPRSSSDTALNTSSTMTACQKSYQQSLEWGRNEQFLKLAHTFHTNNY